MSYQVFASWTEDQVKSLNGWQACGYVHPFTSMAGKELIATVNGWVEDEGGPVVQDWAHDFMLDWSWKKMWPWHFSTDET